MGFEECVVPGKILYLNVCFPQEDKPNDKYFVVVGTGDSPLLLKINTSGKLSEIAKRKGESQFRLKCAIYTFLKYDSYLDCGSVWSTLITTQDVIKQLEQDPRKRVVGEITDDHKNEIIRRTERSNSVSSRHKRIIQESFRKK